jgi:hypothetical protein
MFKVLQVLSVVLVAVGMGLSLAHALEWPGKRKLDRESYLVTQRIYYPGFTIGGMFGEAGATLATLVVLIMTPFGSPSFWMTLMAVLCLVVVQGVFWLKIQPVNKAWLAGQRLHSAGAAFFSVGTGGDTSTPPTHENWIALRDQWEYSHIVRAALAMVALVSLATAVTF